MPLKEEFDRSFLPYAVVIGNALTFFTAPLDFLLVGWDLVFFLWRATFLPLSLILLLLVRKNKFNSPYTYELPIYFLTVQPISYLSGFSLSTGHLISPYANALPLIALILAIMPLTHRTFFGISLMSVAIFVITNLVFPDVPNRIRPGFVVSPETYLGFIAPFFLLATLSHIIQHRLRLSRYDLMVKLRTALETQDQIIRDQGRKLADAEVAASMASLASRVAHDIRSPLTVLNVLAGEIGESRHENVSLLLAATNRIKDIADSLLLEFRNRKLRTPTPSETSEPAANLVSALIEELLSEKRVEFRARGELNLEFITNHEGLALFSKVPESEFKAILSNLINNAAEASRSPFTIRVVLRVLTGQWYLDICDSGTGIPPDILRQLGTSPGITFGKENGSGLGLYQARLTIEKWGGTVNIDSNIGKGTTVTLCLPTSSRPNWFTNSLDLAGISEIIVIDDDPSIHLLYRQKLNSPKYSLNSYLTAREALESIKLTNVNQTRILLDYDLRSSEINGLELVQKLGLESRAILVTSRYRDIAVIEHATRLGIKLMPKPLLQLGILT